VPKKRPAESEKQARLEIESNIEKNEEYGWPGPFSKENWEANMGGLGELKGTCNAKGNLLHGNYSILGGGQGGGGREH